MHVSFTVRRAALLYFFKVCHYKTTLFTLKSIFILQAITVENEDYSEQLQYEPQHLVTVPPLAVERIQKPIQFQ